MLSMQAKAMNNDKNWWVKLSKMSPSEFKTLPYGFIKKYGSILDMIQLQQDDLKLDQNQQMKGYYAQVRNLQ